MPEEIPDDSNGAEIEGDKPPESILPYGSLPSDENLTKRPYPPYRLRQSEEKEGPLNETVDLKAVLDTVARETDFPAEHIKRAFEVFNRVVNEAGEQAKERTIREIFAEAGLLSGERYAINQTPTQETSTTDDKLDPNSPEGQAAARASHESMNNMYRKAQEREEKGKLEDTIKKLHETELPPNPVTPDSALKMPDNPTQGSGNSSSGSDL